MPRTDRARLTASEMEAEIERDPHLRSIADERAADLDRDFQRERAWLWALTEPDRSKGRPDGQG